MSESVELVKAAGPWVVAGISVVGSFWASRRTGREGRHHARVEAVYQDMLDNLEDRYIKYRQKQGLRAYIVSVPNAFKQEQTLTISQIQLYASPAVERLWAEANNALSALEMEDLSALVTSNVEEWRMQNDMSFTRARAKLQDAMRSDLGVPGHRRDQWRRWWYYRRQNLRMRWISLGFDADAQRGNGRPTMMDRFDAFSRRRLRRGGEV